MPRRTPVTLSRCANTSPRRMGNGASFPVREYLGRYRRPEEGTGRGSGVGRARSGLGKGLSRNPKTDTAAPGAVIHKELTGLLSSGSDLLVQDNDPGHPQLPDSRELLAVRRALNPEPDGRETQPMPGPGLLVEVVRRTGRTGTNRTRLEPEMHGEENGRGLSNGPRRLWEEERKHRIQESGETGRASGTGTNGGEKDRGENKESPTESDGKSSERERERERESNT